jgi:hypothetical protein
MALGLALIIVGGAWTAVRRLLRISAALQARQAPAGTPR